LTAAVEAGLTAGGCKDAAKQKAHRLVCMGWNGADGQRCRAAP